MNMAAPPANVIQLRGVYRTYEMGDQLLHALNDVDLDIEAGEFTVLMGPSGSGKTTLLNLIGALDEPTAGTVTISNSVYTIQS